MKATPVGEGGDGDCVGISGTTVIASRMVNEVGRAFWSLHRLAPSLSSGTAPRSGAEANSGWGEVNGATGTNIDEDSGIEYAWSIPNTRN